AEIIGDMATDGNASVTLRDRPGWADGEMNHRCWGVGWPSLRVSARPGRYPMTTTTSVSTAIAVTEPVFSPQERLALAGFLAGYSGLTREAYALELRRFTAWCQQRHLRLFQIRRADIECFARDMEARGRNHHPLAPGGDQVAASARCFARSASLPGSDVSRAISGLALAGTT